jgi:hypothetical protein
MRARACVNVSEIAGFSLPATPKTVVATAAKKKLLTTQ